MAHMVYKKPLQNQEIRENYVKQRQELRKAKELGLIDSKAYEDAKKDLFPGISSFGALSISTPSVTVSKAGSRFSGSTSSLSSGSTVHPTDLPQGRRRGTILDRNNVARLVYKPDVQSEEDRKVLKSQRAMQKSLADTEAFNTYQYQLNETDEEGRLNHLRISPEFLSVPTGTPTIATSASNSSSSVRSGKSQLMSFNIFRKRSASAGHCSRPPSPIPDIPPISLLSQGIQLARGQRPSMSTERSMTRRHTESRGGDSDTVLDFMPMTFADIFLMGPQGYRPRSSGRRHSFSSQKSQPSILSSRQSNEVPAEVITRKACEEFILEQRPPSPEVFYPHTPENPTQLEDPLMSTELHDFFLSLINDFSDTSILFSYPKYGKVRRVSYSSSFRSIPRFTRVDEEMDRKLVEGEGNKYLFTDESTTILKAVLEKQSWFLMAMKWLSFGRILFSPGHHLIELSSNIRIGMGVPEPSILDLDGAATADLSWHLAEEYPSATIYNILLPHSPRPPRDSTAPPNLRLITTPSLKTLSPLASNSIDVIISHNLPRIILQNKNKTRKELIQLLVEIFRECARVLKPSGYFEMTVVDPVMNNMGPRTRNWTTKHIALVNSGMKPSKIILAALEQLSGKEGGGLYDEVKECWVWMPTTSIGDELSTVTSMVGRHLYDHLYAPGEEGNDEEGIEMVYGVNRKEECRIWKDEKVIEECQKENTAFRWLKCYARKV